MPLCRVKPCASFPRKSVRLCIGNVPDHLLEAVAQNHCWLPLAVSCGAYTGSSFPAEVNGEPGLVCASTPETPPVALGVPAYVRCSDRHKSASGPTDCGTNSPVAHRLRFPCLVNKAGASLGDGSVYLNIACKCFACLQMRVTAMASPDAPPPPLHCRGERRFY